MPSFLLVISRTVLRARPLSRVSPIERRRLPAPPSFPELDTLRALAITLVFATHAEGWVAGGAPVAAGETLPFLRGLLRSGHTGVSLFFVLSAFLLARSFLAEAAGGARVDVRAYARRRFWRIMPLYASVVVASAICYAQQWGDLWRAVRYLGFFYNAMIPIEMQIPRLFSGVWWSLATEFQFYLVLPLLPRMMRSRCGRGCGVVLLAGYAAAYASFAFGSLASVVGWPASFTVGHTLFGRAPLFGFGILAALIYERYGKRVRVWGERTAWVRAGGADAILLGLLVVFGGALAGVMRTFTYVDLETRYHGWHLLEGTVWCVVVLLVLLAPLRLRRLVIARAPRAIGEWSYSIYLLHVPILGFGFLTLRRLVPGTFVGWSGPSVAATLGLAAVATACAAITYHVIERPMMAGRGRGRPREHTPTLAVERPVASTAVGAARMRTAA